MSEEDTLEALKRMPIPLVIQQWAKYLESMNKTTGSFETFDRFVKERGWKGRIEFDSERGIRIIKET